MKFFTVFIFLFFLLDTSYAQEGKYDRFKTGKFTFIGEQEGAIVTRTKRKQKEIYPDGKSMLITKIKWLSDSSYILTFVRSNVDGCLKKGDWIKITLIHEDGNSYTCRYSSEKCGEGVTTMVKLD